MRYAGNVIWFVLGGAIISLYWLIGALFFALTVIGLPLTRAALEIAKMSAFPFGKDVVHVRELDKKELSKTTAATGTIGFIANIIWLVTFGWSLCLLYILAGILNCLTLIGIPFGLQAFKLAGISLWPVGRRVVSVELATAAREANAHEQLTRIRAKT